MKNKYTPTIGIEVHAELKTKSKMFCSCANDPHASLPNTHICPVCLAHPGTLPVVNEEAVKSILKIGLAIEGELAEYSEFDRKHYFYPDIPKAYQISQYQYPFVSGGSIAGVEITRIHLEEDTARSIHDQGEGSLIDFNRSGVPLMELVTEPVIHDSSTAGNFARELQLLLRTLGVSDANMEKGEMRVEANVSLSCDNVLGTKVEVKNLNSFKSVENAIAYEIERQTAVLDSGEMVVQETRGWDENKMNTFTQRRKETAKDYRYFPDPDVPKLVRSENEQLSNSGLGEKTLNTPQKKRLKYTNLGLTSDQIETIISVPAYDEFFTRALENASGEVAPKMIANYFITDVLSVISAGKQISDADPSSFAKLMHLLASSKINSRVAKDILFEAVFEGHDPEVIAEDRGLLQKNDTSALKEVVAEVVSQNQSVVAEYKSGKDSALQFLIGQGMKITKGSANPSLLKELILEEIA